MLINYVLLMQSAFGFILRESKFTFSFLVFFPFLKKFVLILFFLMFIYFWDRERQSMSGGGAEREGDTESEAGSRLWTVSIEPDAGLELTEYKITIWAEVWHLTDRATQAYQAVFLN